MAEEEGTIVEDLQDDDVSDSFLKGDEKDQHRIASALGRFLKKQGEQEKFNKQMMDVVSNLEQHLANPPKNTNPDVTKLNEDWQNRILNGDVVGVLDEFTSLKSRAETEISQANISKVNQLMEGLSEQAFFGDIEKAVRETSISLVQQGKDPQTAVDLAYNKARADYFGGLLAHVNKTNPNALKLAKGGSKPETGEPKGKLPDDFKKRAEKDIADKLFKDEAEWIANLSPQIRKQLGV